MNKQLTPAVFEAQVRKPPNVAQTHRIGHTRHDKVPFGVPGAPFLIRGPQAHTRGIYRRVVISLNLFDSLSFFGLGRGRSSLLEDKAQRLGQRFFLFGDDNHDEFRRPNTLRAERRMKRTAKQICSHREQQRRRKRSPLEASAAWRARFFPVVLVVVKPPFRTAFDVQ